MSVKTEILSTPEIKQSDIETKVYNQDAQFYEYCESAENKTIVETGNRPRQRIVLAGSLTVLGALLLFGGLTAAFFYLSGKMFQTATVNQISVENLPKDKSGDAAFGEGENQQKGFEEEKAVIPNLPDDKNNFGKKEVSNPTEPKTVKITERNQTNPLPNRNSKIETSATTTKSNFTKQSVQNDSRLEVWKNPTTDKNLPRQPVSSQNQRDSRTQNNSERFQNSSKNRQEYVAKKIKQANPEQREQIKERFQKQRRKN